MMLKIHWLQHVPFEGLGSIEKWIHEKGHSLSKTSFHTREPTQAGPGPAIHRLSTIADKTNGAWPRYANEIIPDAKDFDLLMIMGGPMNIYEHDLYPWLLDEKRLIKSAIEKGKKLLGICLGAQLIADVLGGPVTKGKFKEIGWWDLEKTSISKNSSFSDLFPTPFKAFHWHGDTFQIPPSARHLLQSEGCAHQAFEYEKRVLGLQFHLESTPESIQNLIQNCPEDLVAGPFVQSPKEILSQIQNVPKINTVMESLLNKLTD